MVRIENLDPTREIAGISRKILNTLQALGMEWDGEMSIKSSGIKRIKQRSLYLKDSI